MSDTTAGGSGSGAGGGDFLASLPTEVRGEGALKNFGGADGGAKLAKSYLDLNRAFSSRSMADAPVPGDDAGRRAVLAKLGAAPPESPDKYNLPDKPSAKAMRDTFHKHGLSAKQAEGLFADIDGAEQRATTERKARMDTRARESTDALRREWGAKFDAEMEQAKRGFEHFLPEPVRQYLEATGAVHIPEMTKLFNQLGRALKEGTMLTGAGAAGSLNSAAAIKAERTKIETEMTAMQKQVGFDPISPAFQAIIARRNDLLNKESRAFAADTARATA